MNVDVGDRVTINKTSPLFAGCTAVVAYVGIDGISVYLMDHDFDDVVPLNYGEFDVHGDFDCNPGDELTWE